MKKQLWALWAVYLAAAAAMVLVFASRVSPVHSLLLGQYGGNAAADAMLIGKYWLEGALPYQDLFAVGGPLYFAVQAAGWFLGGRTGIMILEIISLWIYLIFLHRTLELFARKKQAICLTLLSLIPYMALCSGGNSPAEWCLPLCSIALFYTLRDVSGDGSFGKTQFILGLVCGAVLMLGFQHGGLLYGLALFVLIQAGTQKGIGGLGKAAFRMLCGAAVPLAFVLVCYAQVDKGLLWKGGFLYAAKAWFGGFDSLNVILHKTVKCSLMAPLLAAAVYQICKKERKLGICLLLGTLGTLFFLLLADNVWYNFIITMPCVSAAAAIFLGQDCRVCTRIGVSACVVGMALICAIPLKNYAAYLFEGTPDVIEEFIVDFQSNRAEMPEAKILFLDTASSYLLELDEKPICRYFSNQTQLEAYGADVSAQTAGYLDGGADLVVTTDRGWIGRELENYVVTQVYCKIGGSVFIYIPYETV